MTAPIDLEALRAALAKVVVHPLHHFGDVITDAYVSRKSDWELIAEALAELTTRRARDADVQALVEAASTLKVCGDGRGYFESGDDCNRFRAALLPFQRNGAKP